MRFVSHLKRFELGPADNAIFGDEFRQLVKNETTEMQLDFAIHEKSLSQNAGVKGGLRSLSQHLWPLNQL